MRVVPWDEVTTDEGHGVERERPRRPLSRYERMCETCWLPDCHWWSRRCPQRVAKALDRKAAEAETKLVARLMGRIGKGVAC